jgi:cytochrome c peroxidase
MATLATVINHYNLIPGSNDNLDPRLRRPGGNTQSLNLTQQQKDNLAAFLRTLTGSNIYTDEKWSNPFDANNQLTLIVLPPDAVEIIVHENGAATVACQAVPGLSYQLQHSTDLQDWNHVATLVSDATGRCENAVEVSGSAFYRFTYQPPN